MNDDSPQISFERDPIPRERGKRADPCGGSGERTDRRYRQLLESIYHALLITDTSGNIVECNTRSCDYFLFEQSELVGKNVSELIAGESQTLIRDVRANLAEDKYSLIDARCVRKDGSRFDGEIVASEMMCDDCPRLCFFVRDLTVRKQAEKALTEALQRLEKQERARALLMSNVTHELRTPLTSITYGISNLRGGVGGQLPEKVREYLDRFDRECKRILNTVDDILDLERMEVKSMRLRKGKTSAPRLAERAVSAIQAQAKHKGIAVAVADGMTGFVFCDARKMERALVNITGNAVKYTPDNGRISVNAGPHPLKYGHVVFSVEDTGVGIPPHALERVMDRYYRVGERADGAGLGLAIAKEIVAMHGGTIEIESPPPGRQKGTRVSVTLQAVEPPRILAAGDVAGREKLEEALRACVYEVSAASELGSVRELAETGRFDLVAVAFPFAAMELAEAITSLGCGGGERKTPVIAFWSEDLDGAKRELLESFGVAAIAPPWSIERTADFVESAIMEREKPAD